MNKPNRLVIPEGISANDGEACLRAALVKLFEDVVEQEDRPVAIVLVSQAYYASFSAKRMLFFCASS
jgi:hypothetical protein